VATSRWWRRDWVGAVAAIGIVTIGAGVLVYLLASHQLPGQHRTQSRPTPTVTPALAPTPNMPPATSRPPGVPPVIVVTPGQPSPAPTHSSGTSTPSPAPTIRIPPAHTPPPSPKPIVCLRAPLLDACLHGG
jgi:hypothetical protein